MIKMTRYLILSDYFAVTKKLIANSIPLIQEYDFDGPLVKNRLEFEMRSGLKLRYYQ